MLGNDDERIREVIDVPFLVLEKVLEVNIVEKDELRQYEGEGLACAGRRFDVVESFGLIFV